MIHGFTGSPWEMRYLGKQLHNAGYTVHAPLLQGHGTTPQEMIQTKWIDWFDSVEEGYRKLQEKCTRIHVAGLSMGGVLALHLSAHNPAICSVISLSAAFLLKDPKLVLLPLAKRFPINLIYRYEKEIGKDIRDPEARAQMVCYDKTPVPCVVSLVEFIEHTKQDLRQVSAPALIVHAKDDHLVPYENLEFIHRHIRSSIRQTLTLKKSYHVVTVDIEKDFLAKAILDFVKKIA